MMTVMVLLMLAVGAGWVFVQNEFFSFRIVSIRLTNSFPEFSRYSLAVCRLIFFSTLQAHHTLRHLTHHTACFLSCQNMVLPLSLVVADTNSITYSLPPPPSSSCSSFCSGCDLGMLPRELLVAVVAQCTNKHQLRILSKTFRDIIDGHFERYASCFVSFRFVSVRFVSFCFIPYNFWLAEYRRHMCLHSHANIRDVRRILRKSKLESVRLVKLSILHHKVSKQKPTEELEDECREMVKAGAKGGEGDKGN